MNTFSNPSTQQIADILRQSRHIAVVGLSPMQNRPSHQVARAMQGFGYHILPVRPAVDSVLGEKAFADLHEVTGPVDIVNVFRAPDKISPVVDACIELQLPVLWFQDGVVNEAEAIRATEAGIVVIMDRCIYRDYCQFLNNN